MKNHRLIYGMVAWDNKKISQYISTGSPKQLSRLSQWVYKTDNYRFYLILKVKMPLKELLIGAIRNKCRNILSEESKNINSYSKKDIVYPPDYSPEDFENSISNMWSLVIPLDEVLDSLLKEPDIFPMENIKWIPSIEQAQKMLDSHRYDLLLAGVENFYTSKKRAPYTPYIKKIIKIVDKSPYSLRPLYECVGMRFNYTLREKWKDIYNDPQNMIERAFERVEQCLENLCLDIARP